MSGNLHLQPPCLPLSIDFLNKKWPTYADFNFTKDQSTLLLNHGSFGGTPNIVIQYRNQLQEYFKNLQASELSKKECNDLVFELYSNLLEKTGRITKLR